MDTLNISTEVASNLNMHWKHFHLSQFNCKRRKCITIYISKKYDNMYIYKGNLWLILHYSMFIWHWVETCRYIKSKQFQTLICLQFLTIFTLCVFERTLIQWYNEIIFSHNINTFFTTVLFAIWSSCLILLYTLENVRFALLAPYL